MGPQVFNPVAAGWSSSQGPTMLLQFTKPLQLAKYTRITEIYAIISFASHGGKAREGWGVQNVPKIYYDNFDLKQRWLE